jgi:hypothetical protein
MDIKRTGTVTLANGSTRKAAEVVTRFGDKVSTNLGYWTGGSIGAGRWTVLTAQPVEPKLRAIAETFVPDAPVTENKHPYTVKEDILIELAGQGRSVDIDHIQALADNARRDRMAALTAEQRTLLTTFAAGPVIWDAADLFQIVCQLDTLGLVRIIGANGLAEITDAGHRVLLNGAGVPVP